MNLSSFDEESIKKCFKDVMKETGIKGKAAFEKIEVLLFDKNYGSDRMSLLGCVRRMPKEQKVRVKEKIMQDQLLRENINRR